MARNMTEADKADVWQQYGEGASAAMIARALGFAVTSVAAFIRDAGKPTLVPLFVPFGPASTILKRFPSALAAVLQAHGVARPLIDGEVIGAGDHLLATTNDRSVVGVMTEFVRLAEWRRDDVDLPEGLLGLSVQLARTPCGPLYGRHVSPDRELHAVLAT